MKKLILTAVAAGAMAVGGAASAQSFGDVLGSIFGYGQPTYNQGYGTPQYGYGGSQPAIVAGAQGTVYVDQYGRRVDQYGRLLSTPSYGSQQLYQDQYGRQFYYDQYGRQVIVQSSTNVYGANNYGTSTYGGANTYGITGYDAWGRPVYGNTGSYAYNTRDRDGDGVADSYDRYPDDRRYR